MGRERELKFTVDEAGAADLRLHPLLRGVDGTPRRAISTYFDTPDFRLHRAGFILRVRVRDGSIVQTVKLATAAPGGLLDRGEWEAELPQPTVDLDRAAETPLAALLDDPALRAMLRPRFTTRIERSSWQVTVDGTKLQLVIDVGDIVVGSLTEAVSEVELELVAGDPETLFAVARQLSDTVRLHPATATKSDRAVALTTAFPPAVNSRPVAMRTDWRVADGLASIAGNCVVQLASNAAPFSELRDPEALHQAHVATRRLRTMVRIFEPAFGDADRTAWRRIGAEWRVLGRLLGQARNYDVLLDLARDDEAATARLLAKRTAAYDAAVAAVGDRQCSADLIEALAMARPGRDGGAGSDDLLPFAGAVLSRLRQRLLKAGRHFVDLPPEEQHRVRIRAKQLRYASEFFAALYPGKTRHGPGDWLARLRKLQASLGDLNDLATAELMLGAGYRSTGSAVDRLIGRSQKRLTRLAAAKPFWE